MNKSEHKIKNKQKLTAIILGALLVVAVIFMTFTTGTDSSDNEIVSKKETIRLEDVSRSIDPEDEWQVKSENELNELKEQLLLLNRTLLELKSNKPKKEEVAETIQDEIAKRDEDFKKAIGILRQEIDSLKQNPKPETNVKQPTLSASSNVNYLEALTYEETKKGVQQKALNNNTPQTSIINHAVSLVNPLNENKMHEKDIQNYIPTGSYAKAMILSGVHAAAAVRSQKDPRPILFRITGPAVTANHQNINIVGCMVTGEAYGDISSERAFVRLHDMTCSKQEGKVIETKIQGYAASVGTGIPGRVIRREGDFLSTAFWSGIFGGLGKSASDANASISQSALGSVRTVKGEDVLVNALGEGVASAADRVSKYHIERAEQYHPVIEVKAGIEVELVFVKGVYLDGGKDRVS